MIELVPWFLNAFLTLSHYNSFLEQTTEMALKMEGESCGSYVVSRIVIAGAIAGDCAPGLECKHDPMIPDGAGECVLPGRIFLIKVVNTKLY